LAWHAKSREFNANVACCAPGLLEERLESVYKRAAGFSDKATSLFTLDLGPPQDLPDALRGESWLFVQLPLGLLREELRAVDSRETFGASFPLASAGLDDLPDDTPVPGALPVTARFLGQQFPRQRLAVAF
jgi:hypothetical protein